MDKVRNNPETDIMQIVGFTHDALMTPLSARRASIASIPRKTFRYASGDRGELDVYYPTKKEGKAPLLFFVYGGGMVSGARILDAAHDLIYAGLGSFFAARGFATVIADYRLAPVVSHPKPAEDVRDAIRWVVGHANEVGNVDTERVYALGHSAGAANAITMVLLPSLLDETTKRRIKGVVLCGLPFSFGTDPAATPDVLRTFYHNDVGSNCPQGLLKAAPDDVIKTLPPLLLVRSEREPAFLVPVIEQSRQLLHERGVNVPEIIVAAGHNHISLCACLGSGEGEEWADAAADWLLRQA